MILEARLVSGACFYFEWDSSAETSSERDEGIKLAWEQINLHEPLVGTFGQISGVPSNVSLHPDHVVYLREVH